MSLACTALVGSGTLFARMYASISVDNRRRLATLCHMFDDPPYKHAANSKYCRPSRSPSIFGSGAPPVTPALSYGGTSSNSPWLPTFRPFGTMGVGRKRPSMCPPLASAGVNSWRPSERDPVSVAPAGVRLRVRSSIGSALSATRIAWPCRSARLCVRAWPSPRSLWWSLLCASPCRCCRCFVVTIPAAALPRDGALVLVVVSWSCMCLASRLVGCFRCRPSVLVVLGWFSFVVASCIVGRLWLRRKV